MFKKIAVALLVSLLNFNCASLLVGLFFSNSQLIDSGYRVPEPDMDASPVFVIGENIARVDDKIRREEFADDKSYFERLRSYFRSELEIWSDKFPGKKRTEILARYGNRNAERILTDGFYYGCADLCALVGSVLINNGYDCKLIYTVSQKFSNTKNFGHVYLYIEKKDNRWLYDPAMSRRVISGYVIGTHKVTVKSTIGDQFIYTVHDAPGKLGMIDRDVELSMRYSAFKYWQALKLGNHD